MLEKKIKLKDGERIIKVARRYGLTFFWYGTAIILLIITPFFFMFYLFKQGWWGQVLFFTPLTLGIVLIIRNVFLWKRNAFVITTHRLIDMDQRGFFETIISEVPYDQIEDVSGKVKGFWGTIFRYGTLSIQTGSGKVQIIVDKIKHPYHIQQDINERREKYLSKYSHNFSDDVADVIIDKLYELELAELMRVKKVLISRLNKLR